VKISCFLSQFANVGLSLRCTKESKEYALDVNKFVKGEKQFRDFELDEYGLPKLKGIDRPRDLNDKLRLSNEYYQQKQACEIIEKKLENYRIPPDIFDFAQQYYPDIYDKIKKFQSDDEYDVNSELKELIEPIVKREYEIQVNEAKNACRDIFNKLYSS
jgi:geranylgeranyl pyrophosphate synthase